MTAPANTTELTVSELSGAIKRAMETTFDHVRVRGEVSGFRGPVSSGHVYFGLKDQSARLDAVIWKGVYGRLKFRPEEGMEVIATGKISTFPGSSRYQIVIDSLEPAGAGALLLQLEERRKRLAAEGLFDPARKQLLPYLPRVIGVVTSPTGAVIRDIIHRVSDRFPRHILVWPVRVQGETSAAEVAAAIRGFNALPEGGRIPRPDVLIVARGGGSLEDLWGFKEDIVVRAAAESMIPLVSAVGHETDTTLIDHAADRRAPTPTGAAEMILPVRSELRANVRDLDARLVASLGRLLESRRAELRSAARALPRPEDMLAAPRQRVDLAAARLQPGLKLSLERRQNHLGALSMRLGRQSPRARLAKYTERVRGLGEMLKTGRAARLVSERKLLDRRRDALVSTGKRLSAALGSRLQNAGQNIIRRREQILSLQQRLRRGAAVLHARQRQGVATLSGMLETLGYRQVLKRGFALVRDAAGAPLRAAADIEAGASLEIEFADGRIRAAAKEGKTPMARGPARPGGQGSLF